MRTSHNASGRHNRRAARRRENRRPEDFRASDATSPDGNSGGVPEQAPKNATRARTSCVLAMAAATGWAAAEAPRESLADEVASEDRPGCRCRTGMLLCYLFEAGLAVTT